MANVLVVDDDADIRALLGIVLQDRGHRVAMATDGAAALRFVQRLRPDVLVLDVMMPAIDGFGVLRELRRKGFTDEMRIILLTCKSDERDLVQGWELGADEYLTKPFDPAVLVSKVEQLLAAEGRELEERRGEQVQKAELLDRLDGRLARRARRAH